MTTICPHCRRRLLSHASACCNWCGQEIQDAAYQEQAQEEREAYFAHQAARDAQSLANMASINVNASDPRAPLFGPAWGHRREREAAFRAARAQQDSGAMARLEAEHLEQAAALREAAQEQAVADEAPAAETSGEDAGARFRHLEL